MDAALHCSGCKRAVPAEARHCPNCGVTVGSKRSWWRGLSFIWEKYWHIFGIAAATPLAIFVLFEETFRVAPLQDHISVLTAHVSAAEKELAEQRAVCSGMTGNLRVREEQLAAAKMDLKTAQSQVSPEKATLVDQNTYLHQQLEAAEKRAKESETAVATRDAQMLELRRDLDTERAQRTQLNRDKDGLDAENRKLTAEVARLNARPTNVIQQVAQLNPPAVAKTVGSMSRDIWNKLADQTTKKRHFVQSDVLGVIGAPDKKEMDFIWVYYDQNGSEFRITFDPVDKTVRGLKP